MASSTAICNEIADQRPDLAHVLMQPFTIDRKGEVPNGKGPTYELPAFRDFAGHITTTYARSFIRAAQSRPGVERPTPAQNEAMDMVDAFRFDMDFRPGDIQFLHNHQIFRARTVYKDHAEPPTKRHLLRLWLSARSGRPLPPGFEERYGPLGHGAVRAPGRVLDSIDVISQHENKA